MKKSERKRMKCVSYTTSAICLMMLIVRMKRNDKKKKKKDRKKMAQEKNRLLHFLYCANVFTCANIHTHTHTDTHTPLIEHFFFLETAIVAFYTRSSDTFSSRVTPRSSRVTRPTVGENF